MTDDFSNYRWYKGESENPYLNDKERPLAAAFWNYEKNFHFAYLESRYTEKILKEAYNQWKTSFIKDYLSGKSPNPYGDKTDWEKVFKTGTK